MGTAAWGADTGEVCASPLPAQPQRPPVTEADASPANQRRGSSAHGPAALGSSHPWLAPSCPELPSSSRIPYWEAPAPRKGRAGELPVPWDLARGRLATPCAKLRHRGLGRPNSRAKDRAEGTPKHRSHQTGCLKRLLVPLDPPGHLHSSLAAGLAAQSMTDKCHRCL